MCQNLLKRQDNKIFEKRMADHLGEPLKRSHVYLLNALNGYNYFYSKKNKYNCPRNVQTPL